MCWKKIADGLKVGTRDLFDEISEGLTAMYEVTEEVKIIEGEKYTVYGIKCGEIYINGICASKTELEDFTDKLNKSKLSAVHMREVIEDYLS